MKKTFFYLSLMIPALISEGVSSANTPTNVQPGSEPAVKEVKYDVPSDNDDSEIRAAVKQAYRNSPSSQDDLSDPSKTDLSSAEAEDLVRRAILSDVMNGNPTSLLVPEDELTMMKAHAAGVQNRAEGR